MDFKADIAFELFDFFFKSLDLLQKLLILV